ncbi:MAG: acyltransferase [Ilumatobacteraceae bacterium]
MLESPVAPLGWPAPDRDTAVTLAVDSPSLSGRRVARVGPTRFSAPDPASRVRGLSAPLPGLGAIDTSFRADIEGLRALAVIAVLLYHADLLGFSGGYVGVDAFFVVSGFLITRQLLASAARELPARALWAEFSTRRIRWLLPLASLVLLVTLYASYHELGFLRGNVVASDARWSSFFAANLRFARTGTDYLGEQAAPSPLQHFWSLAVEEQFYVVWPLLILSAMAFGRRRRCPAVAPRRDGPGDHRIVRMGVHRTGSNGTWAYFSPATRAWELSLGGLVAVLATVRRPTGRIAGSAAVLGLVAVVVAAFLFDDATAFPATPQWRRPSGPQPSSDFRGVRPLACSPTGR